jgi:hypothetical protein
MSAVKREHLTSLMKDLRRTPHPPASCCNVFVSHNMSAEIDTLPQTHDILIARAGNTDDPATSFLCVWAVLDKIIPRTHAVCEAYASQVVCCLEERICVKVPLVIIC